MLSDQLLSLSSAFSDAYPTVSDYGAALQLSGSVINNIISSNNEENDYQSLVHTLFAKKSHLWCKIFCLAVILSKYVSFNPDGGVEDSQKWRLTQRFLRDYSLFLCQSQSQTPLQQEQEEEEDQKEDQETCDQNTSTLQEAYGQTRGEGSGGEGEKEWESDLIGFHVFIVSHLSVLLQSVPVELTLLLDDFFQSLCGIKYDNLWSMPGTISCLQPTTLFHVLHQVMHSQPAESVLWKTLLVEDFHLLDKVVRVVLNTPSSELRSKVVKLLFSSLAEVMQQQTASSPKDSLNFILQTWSLLVSPLLALGDLQSSSVVVCCLVEVVVRLPAPLSLSSPSSQQASPLRELNDQIWHFVCTCLNDNNSIIRRRGAHLMQKITVHGRTVAAAAAAAATPTGCSPDSGNELPSKDVMADKQKQQQKQQKQQQKQKQQKKTKKQQYSEAEESLTPLFFPGGDRVTRVSWPLLFLDVYQQMEGCTSMHLLSQVWPQLNLLMKLAAQPEDKKEDKKEEEKEGKEGKEGRGDSGDVFVPPVLSFAWMKILLNCCLQSQMSPIKKLIMHEILSGKLLIPMGKETIHWFCHEFLSVVDSPSLFTTVFEELLVEAKWQREAAAEGVRDPDGVTAVAGRGVPAVHPVHISCDDSPGWLDEQSLAQRNPGILIAVFMGRWVLELSRGKKAAAGASGAAGAGGGLLQQFLSSLLTRVSFCHSSQAVKWILRCFSFPVVQACLLTDDEERGLFNISTTTLLEIRTLVKEKMLCANIIIRRQIYDGLVNLLLRCCFEEAPTDGYESSSELDVVFKLNLFLDIVEEFGVRETVLIAKGWRHLSRAVSECVGNLSASEVAVLDASRLALLFGVLHPTPGAGAGAVIAFPHCVTEGQVQELFTVASQLYTSPYVDKAKQRHVTLFVQKSVNFLHKICLVDGQRTHSSLWLFGDDYAGGANVLLQNLVTCGGGMTDYSCFLVKTVLATTAAGGDCASSSREKEGHIETVSDFQNHMDMLCQLLELSFTCIREFSVVRAGKIFSSILSLLKHVTGTLAQRSNDTDTLPPFAMLFHLIVISKILQAMQKLQLLHSQVSREEKKVEQESGREVTASFLYQYELQGGESLKQFAAAMKSALLAIQTVGGSGSGTEVGSGPMVSLADYQQAVLAIKTHALTLAAHSSPSPSLSPSLSPPCSERFSESMVEQFPQYGRFSDASLFYSWTALSSGLQLLAQSDSPSPQGQGQDTVPSFALSVVTALLEKATAQLDLASAASVPYVLNSSLLLLQRAQTLLYCLTTSESQRAHATLVVGHMLEVAWRAVVSDDCLDYVTIQTFILLAFDSAALRILDSSIQQEHFEAVVRVGMTNRPHVMQCLMLQLCTVWRQAPTLATPFFIYFPSLLVYREPILDDHNRVDGAVDQADKVSAASVSANSTATIFTVTESSTVLGIDKFHHRHISRVLLLDFLETQHVCEEDAEEEEEFVTCMHHLIETLIAKNTNVAFQSPAMIGSELFGEKLRCWQALCVLSRHMTEALWRRVSDTCFASLTHPCAHGIRVHLEIFFAAMTSKFSHIILPQLLELLVVFNHSQQALSSYFVILGHLTLVPLTPSPTPSPSSHPPFELTAWADQIITALLPWVTCSPGLPRAVAQLLAYRLIPACIPDTATSIAEVKTTTLPVPMLKEIWRFLHENRDIHKMCGKQMAFFETYKLSSKCTVEGLVSIHSDEWGERIPLHILNILLDSVRVSDPDGSESNVGGNKFATTIDRSADQKETVTVTETETGAETDEGDTKDVPEALAAAVQHLQTKITPFDNLQLTIESSIITRQNTSTARPRQDLIVVASLIDKVTNLAGIARTCEIFAAKELVLSDLSVVKSHDFQSISVASAGWMPMREVAYRSNESKDMICYLREMKSKGYQIVGIEQTGGSVGLSNSSPLSAKCLIVLGKEKEGIPVELLAEMDLCIEIPQYGLTRSLNVHVSAALVIWEATKRNMNIS